MQVLGIGHYSRTGKNTLGSLIAAEYFKRTKKTAIVTSFAYKLKDICHQLYAWDGLREPEFYETQEGAALRDVPLPPIGKSPVQIWVDMGTPAVRDNVYDRTWIDYLLRTKRLDGASLLIITDVRFPNEVKAVREYDGILVKTVRGGYGPKNTVADLALFGWDGWDYIAGPTPRALQGDAENLVDCLMNGWREQDPRVRHQTLAIEGAIGQALATTGF